MKRIKTVNGYAIYQAVTQRDADNYGCNIGSYNLYLASDIKDYGLAYSYPNWDDIDSLATAIELANGSNYAIASALAEEFSESTVQDMDLVLEIERRLDSGDTVEQITEALDPYVIDDEDQVQEWELEAAREFDSKALKNWIWLAVSAGQPIPCCLSVEALREVLIERGEDGRGYHNT